MNARYTIPLLKLTAQTDITMYSRRGYGSSEFNTDDLIWNATLSRPFLKGKLVVYADALDILHNRRSTQYAVNAQAHHHVATLHAKLCHAASAMAFQL